MNEVNRTLFIPLYGKAKVSRQGIILSDPYAEKIWDSEGFALRGRSASKWLAYNMAMRARVFDDWTDGMLAADKGAMVLHIGCGLDSRCKRVKTDHGLWIDCDFPDVITVRRRYYEETDSYRMIELDASKAEQISTLPDCDTAVVVLEGICMYLSDKELQGLFRALRDKYRNVHILADFYTVFGARASRYKNPVNDVGVTKVYGVDDIESLIRDTGLHLKAEHSFTPDHLVKELKPSDRRIFRFLFTGRSYRRIYRLYELST